MKTIKLFFSIVFLLNVILCQAQTKENKSKDGVYFIVEEMPVYPGGDEALRNDIATNITYPEEAKKAGIQGKVFVTFVVDELGKVTNSKIARGVDPALDKESLRVMNDLKTWKPGMEKGKAVKVSYTIPINFALGDESKTEKEPKE
jgi:TonB family protein